jgi:hypothetical protein
VERFRADGLNVRLGRARTIHVLDAGVLVAGALVRSWPPVGEFNEHYRQKRYRYVPLCEKCVGKIIRTRKTMVEIRGLGSECVWCGIHYRIHREAHFLVDRRQVVV